MRQIVPAAAAYVAAVLAAGFVLGTIRTLWLAPRIGEVGAVLAEVPLVLAVAWFVAGAVLRRWPLPSGRGRAAMGALAFALLIALEFALGGLVFGRPVAGMLAEMLTPAGLIGLLGQVGFGLIPVFRQPRG